MAIAGCLALFLIIMSGAGGFWAFLVGIILLLALSPMLFLGVVFAIYALIRALWRLIRGPKER